MAIPHFPNTRRFCLKIWDPILCLILILSLKSGDKLWYPSILPQTQHHHPFSKRWNETACACCGSCCATRAAMQETLTASPLSLRLSKRLRVRRLSPIFGTVPMLGGPRDSKSKAQPHQQFDSNSQVRFMCLSGGVYHQNAYRLIFWSRNVPRSFCHHSRLRTAGASCTNLSALASLVPLELALQTFSAWPSKRLSFWMCLNAKIHKYHKKEKVMAWWMMFLDSLDGYLGRRLASGGLLALLGQTEVQNSKSIPWPIRELTWRGAPHLLPKSTGHQSVLFFSSSSAVGTSQSQSSLNLSIKELPLKTVKAMHATLPLSCCGTQLEPQLSSPWAQHKIYSTILRCLWLVTGENVAMYQSCTGWPPTLNLATGNSIWAAAKPLGILSHPPLWLVDKFSATLQKQPFSVLCVMPKYVISNLAPFVWMVYSVLHVFVDSN